MISHSGLLFSGHPVYSNLSLGSQLLQKKSRSPMQVNWYSSNSSTDCKKNCNRKWKFATGNRK